MKTYNIIYPKIYEYNNLYKAYKKARKGKTKLNYILYFEKDLETNLKILQEELESETYQPKPLRKFIIKDPKTRTIHSSIFKDRIVHHAIINLLEPIYEKVFLYDSYANRKNKGTHKAIERFDTYKRKVSKNGKLIKQPYNNNSIQGYYLKADIKHYFQTVDQNILINILKKKIKDTKLISLITKILNNYKEGMPLGNLTSQFFANVYLNELDYFIKHKLKAKYYIRYVDDFIILHKNKNLLKAYKIQINKFLKTLNLELHEEKSNIYPLRQGTDFLGYKIFYHYKTIRKRNLKKLKSANINSITGWQGYLKHANTYNLSNSLGFQQSSR